MAQMTAEEAVALLGDLGEGTLFDDLGEALTEVVKAAVETGKRGSVQIGVMVEPMDKGAPAVVFTGKLTAKRPRSDASAMRYWDGSHLHRHDPAQLSLDDARSVAGAALREGLKDLPEGTSVSINGRPVHPETGEIQEDDDGA